MGLTSINGPWMWWMIIQGWSTKGCISSCCWDISIICTIRTLRCWHSAHWFEVILLKKNGSWTSDETDDILLLSTKSMIISKKKPKSMIIDSIILKTKIKGWLCCNLPWVLLDQQLHWSLPIHEYQPSNFPQSLQFREN